MRAARAPIAPPTGAFLKAAPVGVVEAGAEDLEALDAEVAGFEVAAPELGAAELAPELGVAVLGAAELEPDPEPEGVTMSRDYEYTRISKQ